MSDTALIEALRGSRLAAELSAEQVRILAGLLAFRDLRAGEVLVAQGVSDNHLYVIVSGALAVTRGGSEPTQLFSLGPGDLVGELSFLDATPHYAALIATTPTRVFGLERSKLESLLEGHADIVYQVMRAIIRTVHEIQRRLSMHTVELTNYIYKKHGRY